MSELPKQQQQQQQQGSIGIYNNSKMNVIPNYTLSGMSSFDAESLPDYSEFDSESVTLDYYKERYDIDVICSSYSDNNNHNNENTYIVFCFDSAFSLALFAIRLIVVCCCQFDAPIMFMLLVFITFCCFATHGMLILLPCPSHMLRDMCI